MENNQICIWGPRNGLEIIFSNNEVWEVYFLKNRNLLDSKFSNLILNLEIKIYYLNKIDGYQVFSIVSPYKDSLQRDTFIGISIICKLGLSFGSDLIDALNSMLKQYLDNPSEINKMKNQANSLMPINSNYSYEKSNCVITIDDETLFQNEFGKFKGDTTYFIYPTNNQAVFNRLPNTIHSLKTLVANKPNTQELVNLKNYIQNKSNFDLASTLYERWKNQLTEQEKTNYSYWKQTVEKQQVEDVTSVRLKSLSGTQTLTESDIIFIRHQVLSESPAFLKLYDHEKNLLQEKIKEKKPPSIEEEIVWVNEQIETAKNKSWDLDYSDLLEKIKDTQGLSAAVKEKQIDLGPWIGGFNLHQTIKCEEKINSLHEQIQKIPKNQIESNVRDLKAKLTNLKHQVNELKDTEAKNKFRTDEKFKYLDSEDWIPKNRNPLYLKLAVTILLLTLTTVGFFALKYIGVGEVEKSDKDFDGIEDKADYERNTVWFKDTNTYQVRNYVNVYGKIDTSKTKLLCNCWKFPKAEDRKILLCTDTENWFVFKNIPDCKKCSKPKKDCTCNKPPVENCKKCSKPKKDCTCNKPPVENCNKCAKPKKECTCSKTDHSSYWIDLDKMPDAELKIKRSVIRKNIADEAYTCKEGSPGATARLNIITRLNKL